MNKKLILLMLALPLILMISLFTTTSQVSLVITVPVSKVVINDADIVYMDLDEEYQISYTVYPTNAANQSVYFSYEPYNEDVCAEVDVESGVIKAKSCGKVKVTVTTVDGGFKDSFVVEITTNKLQGINSTLEKEVIKLGESVSVKTAFTPSSAQYQTQLKYEIIEGNGNVSVDSQGKITAENVGSAKIKVYCSIDASVYDEVEVFIENTYPMEFLKKTEALTTIQSSGSLKLFVDKNADVKSYSFTVIDKAGEPYNDLQIAFNEQEKLIAYEFKHQNACDLIIRLTVEMADGNVYSDECTVSRIEKIECNWIGAEVTAIAIDQVKEIYFHINPPNAEIEYEITLSENGKYIRCEMMNGYLLVSASQGAEEVISTYEDKYASELISLTIWLKDQPNEKETLVVNVNVYIP